MSVQATSFAGRPVLGSTHALGGRRLAAKVPPSRSARFESDLNLGEQRRDCVHEK